LGAFSQGQLAHVEHPATKAARSIAPAKAANFFIGKTSFQKMNKIYMSSAVIRTSKTALSKTATVL
jgi:hypothetical protein